MGEYRKCAALDNVSKKNEVDRMQAMVIRILNAGAVIGVQR